MTAFNSLRVILELECKKGYANRAVIGGLNKYLRKQVTRLRQDIPNRRLLRSFDELNLAESNYDSWDTDKRQKWIMSIIGWLDEFEKTKGDTLGSPLSARERNKASTAAVARSHRQKQSGGLSSPITIISGITPRVAAKFAKLGVRTIDDLLHFFPRRYIDYSQRKFIAELEEGKEQTVIGTIWQATVVTLGNRPGTEAIIGDETGNIRVVWFNQPYLAKNFPTNARLVVSGTVGIFKGQKVFESPEWELVKGEELIHTGRLIPVYPLT